MDFFRALLEAEVSSSSSTSFGGAFFFLHIEWGYQPKLTAKQELEYAVKSGGGGGSIIPHLVDRPDMMVVALLVRKAASAPLLSNSQQQSLKIYFISQQFDFQYQQQ